MLAKPDRSEALRFIDEAKKLARTEELSIAEAFALAYEADLSGALSKLSLLDSDESRAAGFIAVANAKREPDPLSWFDKAGLSATKISPDGKLFLIRKQLDSALWLAALETAITSKRLACRATRRASS